MDRGNSKPPSESPNQNVYSSCHVTSNATSIGLRKHEPTAAIVWASNLFVALLFAWMHLIPAAPLLDLNAIAVAVAIVLATIAGALLGWVYWRHGLRTAVFTHAIGGVLVYLGGRALIAFAS